VGESDRQCGGYEEGVKQEEEEEEEGEKEKKYKKK